MLSRYKLDEHEIILLLHHRKEGVLLVGHGRLYGTLRYEHTQFQMYFSTLKTFVERNSLRAD